MKPTSFKTIHPKFTLNQKSFTKEKLVEFGFSLKENENSFQAELGVFLLQWLDANDFIEVQTSGTTGKPKTIKIRKEAMVNSAIATGAFFNLNAGTTALCCLPVKYIAGKMMLVRAMVLGWNLELVEPKSNPLETISKFYDFVAMVPLQIENSIDKLHQIGKLLIGGARVNQELTTKILQNNCDAYESYSMTETVTHIALKKIGEECFVTLPNVSIATDERNCLIINAPLITSNLLITNDIVALISENKFVWKGRFDNVINSGGIKLFPEQIELKLNGKIINRFFIAAMPDDKLGEKVVLFIEGKEFQIDEKSLFSDLTKYEIPKQIIFVNNFIETETGKIKRSEIIANLN